MKPYDWSAFTQKIYIDTDMQRIYDAWTTRTGIEHWFLRKGEFRKPDGSERAYASPVEQGDTYEWFWHGHPDTTVEHGKILEANGQDLFKFSFGALGNVTISLKQTGQETEMILTQDELPTDERGKVYCHLGCATGWTFYLANLKSLMEGGIDLRNKNMEHTGVINS